MPRALREQAEDDQPQVAVADEAAEGKAAATAHHARVENLGSRENRHGESGL